MLNPSPYVDPNLTVPLTHEFVSVPSNQFPSKTLHAESTVYEAEETDRSAVVQTPPAVNPQSFWVFGRDRYANGGSVDQPFFN